MNPHNLSKDFSNFELRPLTIYIQMFLKRSSKSRPKKSVCASGGEFIAKQSTIKNDSIQNGHFVKGTGQKSAINNFVWSIFYSAQ
jgi:hypothetical protein